MNIKSDAIQLSLVIPLFNEEENIEELYYQIKKALTSFNKSYEIIFVDDGSKDKTYDIIRNIHIRDKCVKIIKLAKNYKQSNALLAGFEFVRGGIVITMDGDLQNNPDDIPKFLNKIEEGFDFVNGYRLERNDPLCRKLVSRIANWLIARKTGVALHDYGCAFIATKKHLIDKLRSYGSGARFIKPLLVRLAASVAEIEVNHSPRSKGMSKYDLLRIIRIGLDFLLNFSLIKNTIKFSYVVEEVVGD